MSLRPTSGMGVLRISKGAVLWRLPGKRTAAVGSAPTITTQPIGGFFSKPHTFTITATGTATLLYQWQRDTGSWTDMIDDANHTGVTTPNLVWLTADIATIRCVVTNDFGQAISDPASFFIF